MQIKDLIQQITLLSKNKEYAFCNRNNKNTFQFIKHDRNTHALVFMRIQESRMDKVSVSEMNLQKIANKVRPYIPFQIDVIVGASGNWRSLFESALAYTPEFYQCKINRQRHLIWAPKHPHELGITNETSNDLLKVFDKQSRFYDFQYFIENCYPFSGCYENFCVGMTSLLKIFRRFNDDIYSVYDISEIEKLEELIHKAEENHFVEFHAPLPFDSHFCLYDISQAYLKFLNAKQYFAYY